MSMSLNSLDRKSLDEEIGQSYEVSYMDKISNSNLGFLHDNIFNAWINYEKYSRMFDINYLGYLRRNDFEKLEIVKNQNFFGNKKLNSQHISIGKDLSIHYDINIGDKILIMSPTGIETIVGSLPKQETYIVDSVFDSGISDFDQNIAFININDLENLFNLDENSRSLEIYFNDPKKIELKKKILQEIFQEEHVYTWSDLNRSLFSALKVERNVMFIILSLIIIVAAFNIISGLTILVKNKTREIAILKSIGVQNKSIIKIFLWLDL